MRTIQVSLPTCSEFATLPAAFLREPAGMARQGEAAGGLGLACLWFADGEEGLEVAGALGL